jgi:2,4-dienoyl-CoA reductase-like NADH-dependent reductase (Old Yellow Enzyme family)
MRADEYGSAGLSSLTLLRRIVYAIRAVVPKGFVLGVKVNAADYMDDIQQNVESEPSAMKHISSMAQWGNIDFIEISGGDYEDPGQCSITARKQASYATPFCRIYGSQRPIYLT